MTMVREPRGKLGRSSGSSISPSVMMTTGRPEPVAASTTLRMRDE